LGFTAGENITKSASNGTFFLKLAPIYILTPNFFKKSVISEDDKSDPETSLPFDK
jgi:hypothetical protein